MSPIKHLLRAASAPSGEFPTADAGALGELHLGQRTLLLTDPRRPTPGHQRGSSGSRQQRKRPAKPPEAARVVDGLLESGLSVDSTEVPSMMTTSKSSSAPAKELDAVKVKDLLAAKVLDGAKPRKMPVAGLTEALLTEVLRSPAGARQADHHELEVADRTANRMGKMTEDLVRSMAKGLDCSLSSFTMVDGMISAGGDMLQAMMTIEQAKEKARSLAGCKGFTFEGPPTKDKVLIYFKSKCDIDGLGGTSFKREGFDVKEALPHLRNLGEKVEEALDLKTQLLKFRRENHRLSTELADQERLIKQLREEVAEEKTKNELLQIKYNNIYSSDKQKGMDLMVERRRTDEVSKHLREMCDNLLCIVQSGEMINASELAGLRKRCFKLVRQNTTMTGQLSLLQRQRRWAQAKSDVISGELKRIYLGSLGVDNVKSEEEIGELTEEQFENLKKKAAERKAKKRSSQKDEKTVQIYQPLIHNAPEHKEASIDFLTHLTETGGEEIASFLSSPQVYSEEIRDVCIAALGREFFAQWQRSQAMIKLVTCVERLVNLTETEHAIGKFVNAVCELLNCDRATLWVVDRVRRIMWTSIKETRKGVGDDMIALEMDLPKDGADMTGMGLVAAAYSSRSMINVADAHSDPRFNRGADNATGYRTKSVLCLPIVRNSRVRLVLQAVNKLDRDNFDHNGEFVLRLLGHVAFEVLEASESNSSSSTDSKRKDWLMQLAGEMMSSCNSPRDLVVFFERGLKELFRAESSCASPCALHLVYGDYTKELRLASNKRRTIEEVTDGFVGLVGRAVRTRSPQSISTADLGGKDSEYRRGVDLEVPEEMLGRKRGGPEPTAILHTVPFFHTKAGNSPSTVIQFLCIERERRSFGDDGTYSQYNRSHVKMIGQLMTYVHSSLERWYPVMERLCETTVKNLATVQVMAKMKRKGATAKDVLLAKARKSAQEEASPARAAHTEGAEELNAEGEEGGGAELEEDAEQDEEEGREKGDEEEKYTEEHQEDKQEVKAPYQMLLNSTKSLQKRPVQAHADAVVGGQDDGEEAEQVPITESRIIKPITGGVKLSLPSPRLASKLDPAPTSD